VIRIGVIADAHANLPATVAALDRLAESDCAAVVHVGDAIAIGPHPREVLALLLERDVACVMGNHDAWFAFGLPSPRPPWMSEGELEHQHWTHAQLSQAQREAVRAWPYELRMRLGTSTVAFIHYGRLADGEFDYVKEPTGADFDRLFSQVPADLVVFGHDHRPFDLSFQDRRFLSPGSCGCHDRAEARTLVLSAGTSGVAEVQTLAVPYDDAALFADFGRRGVPERDFIRRTFITRPGQV
jgi:putative phosphoesterase